MRKGVIQNMKSEVKIPSCISSLNQNQIKIVVSAKPGAKVSAISEINDDSVIIQIGAPPVYDGTLLNEDGKANKELIDYLSSVLDAKKTSLSIDKGGKSKNKIVLYDTDQSSAEIYEKIVAMLQ